MDCDGKKVENQGSHQPEHGLVHCSRKSLVVESTANVQTRMDSIERGMLTLSSRIDRLESRMDERMSRMESLLQQIAARVSAK